MKKNTKWLIAGAVIVIVALFYWSKALQANNPDIISKEFIHWHPHLSIIVDGKEVVVPANVGLDVIGAHPDNVIHTHDASGVLHMEMYGPVRGSETKLKEFFKVWGKDMSSFGKNMVMYVNGKENTELGEYQMKDGDKIELRYTD